MANQKKALKPKNTMCMLGASALVLSMAACGNAGATSDGTNAASSTRPTSPLNQIMEPVWGSNLSQEEAQRRNDERAMQVEELTAQCMNELGFEYTPNPNSGGTVIVDSDDTWQPENRDWVAQWGFGVVNNPWNARWEAENAAREESGETQFPVDPNAHLWDTMSESEMRAWQQALWGPPMEDLPEGIWNSETGEILDNDAWNEHRGCQGRAWAQVDADSPWNLMQSEEFRPLTEAMNGVWDSVQNDPQWAALDREWSACMANAGYPGFLTQQDANNSIWDQQSEIQNGIDWENWNWDLGSPNAQTVPELAALAEREVELALADFDCRASVDFQSRRDAIQFAHENQFINEHRAALDALVAAATNQR